MTGYGRGSAEGRDLTVTVEVRSVNARHLSVRCRMAPVFVRFESLVEKQVRAALDRGNVDVQVKVDSRASTPRPRIDEDVLAVYRRALDDLGGGDVAGLLRLPGVVTLEDPGPSLKAVERGLREALALALEGVAATREREGQRLGKALARELRGARRHLATVRRLVPRAVDRHHQALRRRLAQLLDGEAFDPEDPMLRRELALLADRGDVTEELDRLESHLDGAAELLERGDALGRELEFLLQEMGREVNTIGSKSNDTSIAGRVVLLKTCLERLREQAANIA